MINPSVKTKAELFQPAKAGAELAVGQHSWRRFVAQSTASVPGRRVANTAEPFWTDGEMSFKHRRHRVAQGEIGVTDDGGDDTAFNRRIARHALGDAFEKLGFAQRL